MTLGLLADENDFPMFRNSMCLNVGLKPLPIRARLL